MTSTLLHLVYAVSALQSPSGICKPPKAAMRSTARGALRSHAHAYTSFCSEQRTQGVVLNCLGRACEGTGCCCFPLVLFPQLLSHKFQLKKEHGKEISILSEWSDGSKILGPQRTLQIPGKEVQKASTSSLVGPTGTLVAEPTQHLPISGFPSTTIEMNW